MPKNLGLREGLGLGLVLGFGFGLEFIWGSDCHILFMAHMVLGLLR